MRRVALLLVPLALLGAKAAPRAPVETLGWSADSSAVVAAGKVGPVVVYDTKGKGRVVGENLGQPRLTPHGDRVVATRDGDFVEIEVSSGDVAPLQGVPDRGRALRFVRSTSGDVVLLKDSVHHEIHRLGPDVLDDTPLGYKDFSDVWTDPRDPLLYVDTGYALEILHLWTGAVLRTYSRPGEPPDFVDAVRDADGRIVILLRDADGARVWSPPDPPGSAIEVPEGGDVAMNGDGSWVAVGGPDGVRLLASVNQAELEAFPTREPVRSVAVAPDGGHVAAALDDGSVKVFDSRKFTAPAPTDRPVVDVDPGRLRADLLRIPPPTRTVPARSLSMPGSTDRLTWAPSGRVVGWVGQKFVELEADGRQLDPAVPLLPGKPFAYSADGTVLAGVTATGVALVDTRNAKRWKVLKEIPTGGSHQQLQWRGPTLVVDAGSGKAQAWDPVRQAPFGEVFTASADPTARFVQSPSGALLCVTGRLPALLDARSGERLTDLAGQEGGVLEATWSADGKRLATAGADGTVLVWDAATLTPLALADGAIGARMAFSPDGSKLLTASPKGGTVIDAATGAALERLVFDGQLATVAWSAAGRMLADNAGNAFFWDP